MAKKPAKRSRSVTPSSHPLPGFNRGQLAEVLDALGDPELGRSDFPKIIRDDLMAFTMSVLKDLLQPPSVLCDLDRNQRLEFAGIVLHAASSGFAMALYRYADALRDIPELSAWRHKRKRGGDIGRKILTQRKVEMAERIRTTWANMEAAGDNPTNDTVAAACGCSRRTVQRAFKQKA
jgi:AraC-like DNA-binding protein